MATRDDFRKPVPVYQFSVRLAAQDAMGRFVSLLPPEHVRERDGLRAEAIIGRARDPSQPVDPDNFLHNEDFLRFLHASVGRNVARCPNLLAEARRVGSGFIYVLDGRNPAADGDNPAREDVLGVVTVEDGRITEYRPAAAYRAYTRHGFMLIDPWLHAQLLEELAALTVAAHPVRPQAPN